MAGTESDTATERHNEARWRFSQMHMGVAVRLTLFAKDRATAEKAAQAAFDRFRTLDNMMSDYQTNSELNQLCRKAGTGPVAVSPELYRVLSVALAVAQGSQGAFDVTAAPLVRLWRKARETGQPPDETAVAAALRKVGPDRITLLPSHQVSLKEGTTIDLGGIAKGFACDEALVALKSGSITAAMVEAGGDLAAGAPPPGQDGWSVKVRGQETPLILQNCAVSTTGDENQHFIWNGQRLSHVIDPRTGWPLVDHSQTTVIAPSGLWADPLAQAESVAPGTCHRLCPDARVYG